MPETRSGPVSASAPESLAVENGFVHFRPTGNATLDDAIELVIDALRFCRENGHTRLMADISALTGFAVPTTAERLFLVEKWAAAAGGKVSLALVVPPDIIDSQKIGVTMAANRGFRTDVFTDPAEARDWIESVKG